ncbi:MAG: sensor histidine kinase [Lachnospiraceae bacterium]|nr:sensor histidine kinase [Lachnospiraceae bacterium]
MDKKSLRAKLWRLFIIASIVPVLILGVFSYINISVTLRENTEKVAKENLRHIDNSLNICLDSYEDILYQIYTNDDMVMWVDRLNDNTDEAVTINQMRRFINSLLNTKEYIRAITIITGDGEVVTYEQMTPATYKSSWLDDFSLTKDELYDTVIKDYDIHLFSTEYDTKFANKDYYLFHIAHRIVDYRDLSKENGIVIISIDEDLLQNVCSNLTTDEGISSFIVDEKGRLISFGKNTYCLEQKITEADRSEKERLEDYSDFLKGSSVYPVSDPQLYLFHDAELGWDIVNVTDLSDFYALQRRQLILIVVLGILILVVGLSLSGRLTKDLVSSVRRIVDGMKEARNGDLSVRIEKDSKMPLEIESIADGFNDMLMKLDAAMIRQREAQIVALEAQINPHFLYNTLDTINWMAIDRDEFDISNAINALATILRYAIDESNAEVLVKDETEWIKKYIYLQQYRLKNSFSCNISVDPEASEALIHKLLLQPFIENAIIHGLDKNRDDAELSITVERDGDDLKIVVMDNGVGLNEAIIDHINGGFEEESDTKRGIGLRNAITRLKMYYGNAGKIHAQNVPQGGTRIEVTLPFTKRNDL